MSRIKKGTGISISHVEKAIAGAHFIFIKNNIKSGSYKITVFY